MSPVCSLPGSGGLFRPLGRSEQNVFTAELFYVISPPERFCPRLQWGRSFLSLSVWCNGLETEAGKEKKRTSTVTYQKVRHKKVKSAKFALF